MLKFKTMPLLGPALLALLCSLSGCGGSSAGSTTQTAPVLQWRQTSNSIEVDTDALYVKEGSTTFDFFGYKSFFFAPGGKINQPRSQSDSDFLVFSIGLNNAIRQDSSPLATKYVPGFVNDSLVGNFGHGPNSIVFIDQGRETEGGYASWEFSYLWRIDKVNGAWTSVEFAQEFGKQFWHSSSNPLDVNGDGVLDFAVSALSSATQVLFLSNSTGHTGISLASKLPESNSGASALIKIAGGKFAVISLPYTPQLSIGGTGNTGSIMTLSANGQSVVLTQSINVRGYGITDTEGYSSIRVADLNGDGLDDFVALGECNTGCNGKLKRIIAFTQRPDGTFASANSELNIPYTYSLPNVDNKDQWADTVGTQFGIIPAKNGSPAKIVFETNYVQRSQVSLYGIRGAVIPGAGDSTILPSSIIWNSSVPVQYRSIIPTNLNDDGIVDYILVAESFDGVKTSSNPYGKVSRVSALLSEMR